MDNSTSKQTSQISVAKNYIQKNGLSLRTIKKGIKKVKQRTTETTNDNKPARATEKTSKTLSKKRNAQFVSDDFLCELIKDDNGNQFIRIRKYQGSASEIDIPEKINGYTVKAVGKEAFAANAMVEEITVPESVESIGTKAFARCSLLKKVVLPADLEVIQAFTFENDKALKQVVMPYGLKKIATGAFVNCEQLETLFHYMKRGISATMTIDRTLMENNLPSGMNYIGPRAFENCKAIQEIYAPVSVKTILKDCFKNCTSLKRVCFHNQLTAIEEGAFEGCVSLDQVRCPSSLVEIGKRAFPSQVKLMCDSDSALASISKSEYLIETIDKDSCNAVSSKMLPKAHSEESVSCFYAKEDLKHALDLYELRSCTPRVEREAKESSESKKAASRFELRGEVYCSSASNLDYFEQKNLEQDLSRSGIKNQDGSSNQDSVDQATILMTGDLMCRPNQQNYAYDSTKNTFDFSESFKAVVPLLSKGDLVIGNMESMVASSFGLSKDYPFIDDRVHLNAPEEYLSEVKKAGFDVVVNAQNHAYDVGVEGIYETLDALNRNQLIHTGLFSSGNDKRYVLFRVNNITIGLVSYFDQARQKMKRANFTNEGLSTLFSTFEKGQIEKDIKDAKQVGAEFVIAYCHWGREYTNKITQRQERFAQMVADAGADYLLGSHSHCLQPYSVIRSADGREVPVLYSAGNFLSDMGIYLPFNRDTLVVELGLKRDTQGKVVIDAEKYHPCQIKVGRSIAGYAQVVPLIQEYESASIERKIGIEEAVLRIEQTIGKQSRFICEGKERLESACLKTDINPHISSAHEKYMVGLPPVAHNKQIIDSSCYALRYSQNENNGIYEATRAEGMHEAIVVCAGQIMYDDMIENDAAILGGYEFSHSFRVVANCLREADFAIGNFASMAAPSYPSMKYFSNDSEKRKVYSNVRSEYLHALKGAGFDALALANPYNVCVGVDGIFETYQEIENNNLIPIGLGNHKTAVVDINGIKIGFLSFTNNCFNRQNVITEEGACLYLNEFSETACKQQIEKVRAQGADIVLVYLNCGTSSSNIKLAERKELAEKVAELGADYIVASIPYVISAHYRYRTSDGREVPIASSLGSFVSGRYSEGDFNAALLQIRFMRTCEGAIEIKDNYIPLKFFKEMDGCKNAVLPAQKYFNPQYKVSSYKGVKTTLSKKLGDELPLNAQRTVYIHSKNSNVFTIEEIYNILGAKPSAEDLRIFGDVYKQPVSGFANRRIDLTEGGVAFIYKHINYQDEKILIRPSDLLEKHVALVVDTKLHETIPTIVVDDVAHAFHVLTKAARDKFDPLTVAVTGSVGKTTTKDMLKGIFNSHCKTLCIYGNNNSLATLPLIVQKLQVDDKAYIQEVHGGTINAAKTTSELISPNIAIITAITASHLGQMGSMEAVVQGKMDITAGMNPDGVLVLNDDSPELHNQHPNVRVCRYSLSNSECDFYASDIHVEGDYSKFKIISKGGEFDAPGIYEARLNIQGTHNVLNAVGAFAVARIAGIPPYSIIASLARFRTEGDRQNVVDVNGAKFLIDVYSTSQLSVLTAVETLEKIEKPDYGRRIVVLGDLTDLGEASRKVHEDTGRKLAKYDFDYLLSFGEESLPLVSELRKLGRKAFYFETRDTFNQVLQELIKPGDVVLFKASSRFDFKGKTISPIYGSISK